MYRQIDAAFNQRFFDLFSEHPLGTNLRKRNVGNLVPGGFDNLDFYDVPLITQLIGNVICLPERQLRTAGANAKSRHYSRCPLPLALALSRSLSRSMSLSKTGSESSFEAPA